MIHLDVEKKGLVVWGKFLHHCTFDTTINFHLSFPLVREVLGCSYYFLFFKLNFNCITKFTNMEFFCS